MDEQEITKTEEIPLFVVADHVPDATIEDALEKAVAEGEYFHIRRGNRVFRPVILPIPDSVV